MKSSIVYCFLGILLNGCGAGGGISISVANKELLDAPSGVLTEYAQTTDDIGFDRVFYQTLNPKWFFTVETLGFKDRVEVHLQGDNAASLSFTAEIVSLTDGTSVSMKSYQLWQAQTPTDLQRALPYGQTPTPFLLTVGNYQTTQALSFWQSDFESFGFGGLAFTEQGTEASELLAGLSSFAPAEIKPGEMPLHPELVEGFFGAVTQ